MALNRPIEGVADRPDVRRRGSATARLAITGPIGFWTPVKVVWAAAAFTSSLAAAGYAANTVRDDINAALFAEKAARASVTTILGDTGQPIPISILKANMDEWDKACQDVRGKTDCGDEVTEARTKVSKLVERFCRGQSEHPICGGSNTGTQDVGGGARLIFQ
ncbi:MAG: hypothetical protein AAB592_01890 [Patescibacteria group bacterium]